jgi:glutathione S-transferase
MKVYGRPLSTCTRKVLTTLAEKGHKAEFVAVDATKGENKQPAYLALQPWGQVPALEDDGFTMYESRAIIRYLDQALPGPALTPASAKDRGRMEQWISVETSNFSPIAMKIVIQLHFGKMRGMEPNMEIVNQAKQELVKPLDVLEAALHDREYLVGSFSLAEICFMPYFEYLSASGVGDELFGPRKHVDSWWKRISQRASWKQVTGGK